MRKVFAVGVLICAAIYAAPVVSLHSSNAGIGTMNFSFDAGTNTITIEEDWTSVAMGALLISGLDTGVDYTVLKIITNNSGSDWTRLANELLDPSGDDDDTENDPQPYPSFVPAGFSTSSDFDGLSFAQGSGLPRTSTAFASVFADELTDARDFLDFFEGLVASGSAAFEMTYGLRDNASNQPFLLVQRPNVSSREPEIPEPATYLLIGSALLGIAHYRRRRA